MRGDGTSWGNPFSDLLFSPSKSSEKIFGRETWTIVMHRFIRKEQIVLSDLLLVFAHKFILNSSRIFITEIRITWIGIIAYLMNEQPLDNFNSSEDLTYFFNVNIRDKEYLWTSFLFIICLHTFIFLRSNTTLLLLLLLFSLFFSFFSHGSH